jgi:hypothetical protein
LDAAGQDRLVKGSDESPENFGEVVRKRISDLGRYPSLN